MRSSLSKAFCVIAALGFGKPAFAQGTPISLLAEADWIFAQDNGAALLSDGDAATSVTFPVIDGQPVDLLFRLPGDIAAPERFELSLSSGSPASSPIEVDLLVSTISDTVGFSSVRAETIDSLSTQVDFRFAPVSAQWVMVRLTPAPETDQITVSEIGLRGQLGPPQSSYAFDQSPAEAIALIQSLKTLGADGMALSESEADLFASSSASSLSVAQFEEIALHASGVTSAQDRQRYQEQINALEMRVRSDIALGGNPAATGGALLAWLHQELLTGGYQEGQTNLSDLLEGGVYNCVSSAVIYAALGQRLGLDVRAIEVPDHAFAILYDGADHSDVETTTAAGFDPSRERQAAFEQLTGYTYIPQTNKAKRREIGLAGLAALIYYNHGVFALKDGRYADALVANFRALSLDPEFDSAIKNALAALGNWSFDLAEQGNWEAAVQTAGIGVSLAPEDRGLAARQTSVWQRWAASLSDAGDTGAAIAVLQRASSAVAGEDFSDAQAYLFISSGETLIKSGDWAGALAAANSDGFEVSSAVQDVLKTWQRDVHLRWSSAYLDAGNYANARDVVDRGLTLWPEDNRLTSRLRYVMQEGAAAGETYADGIAFLSETLAQFPQVKKLPDIAETYVGRAIRDPARAPDIAAGLKLVSLAAPLFADPEVPEELGAQVYERYGHARIDAADWPGAAEIYASGRAAFPNARLLTRNARFVAQNWQRQALETDGPEGLAQVNARLRVLFPDFAGSSDFSENEVRRQVGQLVDAGKIAEAQEALDAAQLVLSAETYREISVYIIDKNARPMMDASNWGDAAQIYAAGLRRFGDDTHLNRNAIYVAQEWTRSVEASEGALALSETMRSLEDLFPGNPKIAEMGLNTLRRAMHAAIGAGDVDQARHLLVVAKPTLSQSDGQDLSIMFFETVAQNQMEAKNWAAALETYAQGRALFPEARNLSRNVAYIVQEWSGEAFADGGAEAVVSIFPVLEQQTDNAKDLERTLKSLFGKQSAALFDAGAPDAALDLIDAASGILATETSADLKVYVYDQWARQIGEGGDWPGAVAMYDRALADVGSESLLENNRKWAASQ